MISLEWLRFLRKKKFWIALFGVLLTAVIVFVNLNNGEQMEFNIAQSEATQFSFGYNYSEYEVDDEAYMDYVYDMMETTNKSLQEMDWHSINENLRDLNLMQADRIAVYAEYDNPDLYYHDYLKHRDTLEAMMVKYNVPKLSAEILPEANYTFGPQFDQQVPLYPSYQMKARYYDKLAQQDIDMLTYSTLDSSTVFLQFMRQMFPLLPIIIVAMLCYDSLQEDKDSGVVKVLMTQPIPKTRYIRKKIMLNIKSVMLVFFIPMLMLSLCMGLFDHYKTFRAPVLANTEGIISLQEMENTLPEIQQKQGMIGRLGITQYFSVSYQYNSPNVNFELMEMWQFTLLCLVMGGLVLIFFVMLSTLLSVLLRNKIAALAVTLLLLLAGTFFAGSANTGTLYALFPFTYMNPVDILSGYTSYTYLNGILVLIGSNLLLYAITLFVFKRKDVL